MSIKIKLYVAFAILFFSIIGLSIKGYMDLTKMKDEYNAILDKNVEQIYLASDLQSNTKQQSIYIQHYIETGSSGTLENFQSVQLKIGTGIGLLNDLIEDENLTEINNKMIDGKKSFDQVAESVIAAVDSGDAIAAREMYDSELSRLNSFMGSVANEMLAFNKMQFTEISHNAEQEVHKSAIITVIIGLLATVICAFLSVLVGLKIAQPLKTDGEFRAKNYRRRFNRRRYYSKIE